MAPRLQRLKREAEAIRFVWEDGLECSLPIRVLRLACPCAHCVSEHTGERLLDPARIPEDLELRDMKSVGNYAYRILFGDGHDTGLYTLEMLRELCAAAAREAS